MGKIIPFQTRRLQEVSLNRPFINYKNVQLYEGYTDRVGEEITACIEVRVGEEWVDDLLLFPGRNILSIVQNMIESGEFDEIMKHKSYLLHLEKSS